LKGGKKRSRTAPRAGLKSTEEKKKETKKKTKKNNRENLTTEKTWKSYFYHASSRDPSAEGPQLNPEGKAKANKNPEFIAPDC